MSAYQDYSDQYLIGLLKDGNEAAFNEIYGRYALILYHQANKMLKDREISKDLVQELFITLWTNCKQLRPDINLAGYFYIAVRNRVFKLIEKGKVRSDYLSAIARYASEISTDTIDKLQEKDLQLILQRELDQLPPRMKEVFELSRKQNLSHSEIAQRLGVSDKTVKKQIYNVLKILKLKLGYYTTIGILIDLMAGR